MHNGFSTQSTPGGGMLPRGFRTRLASKAARASDRASFNISSRLALSKKSHAADLHDARNAFPPPSNDVLRAVVTIAPSANGPLSGNIGGGNGAERAEKRTKAEQPTGRQAADEKEKGTLIAEGAGAGASGTCASNAAR